MDWNVLVTSWPAAAVAIATVVGFVVMVGIFRASADERHRESTRLFEASNKARRLTAEREEDVE